MDLHWGLQLNTPLHNFLPAALSRKAALGNTSLWVLICWGRALLHVMATAWPGHALQCYDR
jgi:hypothetical protein